MPTINTIDVTSLDIDQSIEYKFSNKEVDVKNVNIKDSNKIIVTRRYHDKKDRSFLVVRIYKNNTERASFTTEFENFEAEEYGHTLYIRRDKGCI